jgi:hypothetical protein
MKFTFSFLKINVSHLIKLALKIFIYSCFFLVGFIGLQVWIIYYSSIRGLNQISSIAPMYAIQKIDIQRFNAVYERYRAKREAPLEVPNRMIDPFR